MPFFILKMNKNEDKNEDKNKIIDNLLNKNVEEIMYNICNMSEEDKNSRLIKIDQIVCYCIYGTKLIC